jgi:hypothetical protein
MRAVPRAGSVRRQASIEDLAKKLAAFPTMTIRDLRGEWRRLYRADPPQKVGRHLLELGVAWRLQERAFGGLGPGTKRLLVALAKSVEAKHTLPRTRSIRLKPGTKLIREWRGKTHSVLVLEDGFQWRGQRWRSLSAVAREISGTSWSGPRFFGLQRQADEQNRISTRRAADEDGRI